MENIVCVYILCSFDLSYPKKGVDRANKICHLSFVIWLAMTHKQRPFYSCKKVITFKIKMMILDFHNKTANRPHK